MNIDKKYTLVKEHDKHFELHDSSDDKTFTVAKRDLHPATQIRIMKMKKFAEGGDVDSDDASLQISPFAAPPDVGPAPSTVISPEEKLAVAEHMGIAPQGLAVPEQAPEVVPQPQSAPAVPSVQKLPGLGDVNSLIAQGTQAYMGEAKGLADQQKLQAKAMEEAQAKEQQRQAAFESRLAGYQAQTDKLTDSIARAEVDPDRYWHNKSTGQKITAGIAVLLGGISQGALGLTHNPIQEQINKEIDRDIEGQKMSLGKKQTMLSDNLRIQGNMISAENATRLQMHAMLQGKLLKIAAETADPILMNKAKQQVVAMRTQMMPLQQQMVQHQMMVEALGKAQNNPDEMLNVMRVYAPDKAKEMEERLVPGVGFASRKVPDETLKQMQARQELQSSVQRLEAFAKQNAGSLNPATVQYGHALANQVQDAYRRGNNQGVFKPAEAEFVKSIIDEDPTKFFASFRTLPGYKALRDQNFRELNSMYKAYGLQGRPDISALERPAIK